ncbi:hypothetical protein ABPG72_019936 [Tetrahymena utriculariae]
MNKLDNELLGDELFKALNNIFLKNSKIQKAIKRLYTSLPYKMQQIIQKNEEEDIDEISDSEGNTEKNSKELYYIWKYFQKQEEKILCKICKKMFSIRSSTSTLKRHYQIFHAKKDIKQQTIVQVLENIQFSQEKAEELLLNWIIRTMQPLKAIERPQFIEFITYLQPKFKLFSSFKIKQKLTQLYNTQKLNFKQYLQSFQGKFALTLDLWTAQTTDPYLGITLHYLNEDFEDISVYLDFNIFPHPHTSENIFRKVKKVLQDYEIQKKIISITSDSGPNVLKAVSSLIDNLKQEYGIQSIFQLRCAAHALNIVVNNGINQFGNLFQNTISEIRTFFVKLRKSSQKLQYFMSQQQIIQETQLKPILDIKTRWNSTYLMIERALKLEKTIKFVISTNDDYKDITINNQTWKILTILSELLNPFYQATLMMSEQKNPVSHSILHIYVSLIDTLTKFKSDHEQDYSQEVQLPIDNMKQKLLEAMNHNIEIYEICSVLDPRLKLMLVEQGQRNINQKLKDIYNNYHKTNELDRLFQSLLLGQYYGGIAWETTVLKIQISAQTKTQRSIQKQEHKKNIIQNKKQNHYYCYASTSWFFIDSVTANQLYELSQINFVYIVLVNDLLDKDINKNIQLMSTSDFVKGLIISYMDQGLSSRQTSERISGLINKYKPQNCMVDENFEQQFQISYKKCAKKKKLIKKKNSEKQIRNSPSAPHYSKTVDKNQIILQHAAGTLKKQKISLNEQASLASLMQKQIKEGQKRKEFQNQMDECYGQMQHSLNASAHHPLGHLMPLQIVFLFSLYQNQDL